MRFFIAANIPYYCPLCLCFFFSNFGLRLTMGCEGFISGSPLPFLSATYTWFIVFKLLRVSHRTFSLPAFLPVCRPDKGAVQLEVNGRSCHRCYSRVVRGRRVSAVALMSPRRCPELHRPSSVTIADPCVITSSSASFDSDFDTRRNEKRERA